MATIKKFATRFSISIDRSPMSELNDLYNDLDNLRKQLSTASNKYGDVETAIYIPAGSIDMVSQLAEDFAAAADKIAAVQGLWVTHQLLD
jgi:hypothetical protein